jgi:prepilin-type N-terminal cleavage/methylation domain-containing protein
MIPFFGKESRAPAAGTRSGVSALELLVVLAIIGLLMTMGVVVVLSASKKADHLFADAEKAIGKESPPVQQRTLADAELAPIPNQHLAIFNDQVTDAQKEAERITDAAGAKLLQVYDAGSFKGFAAGTTPDSLAAISSDSAVHYVDQDRFVVTKAQTVPTGVKRIGTPGIYNGTRTTRAINATVAIIDTGIDSSHQDLNVVLQKGFGYRSANDGNGHGTHVAGTVAAKDNGLGVVGVAPGARLWGLKVLGDNGSGSISNVIAALNYVANRADQVDVVNMSLGGGYFKPLNNAVEVCVQRGVTVVVAAGNEALDASLTSPASASSAITVAALVDSDGFPGGRGRGLSAGADDSFARFSNFGGSVDVIAPGVNIMSTWTRNRYAVLSGTSMAAPHVAGLAARIISANAGKGTRLSPSEVQSRIMQAATETIPGRYDQRRYPLINARPN